MKTIRNGGESDKRGGGWLAIGLALPGVLGEFAAIEFALQAADAIDEEPAVEMIDLVLEGDREQIGGLEFNLFLLRRPGADQHFGRAFDLGGEIDHREAALLP